MRPPAGRGMVVALVTALSACSPVADTPSEPGGSAEAVDLVVDVAHPRSAQALGVLHVQLLNTGGAPLEVASLQLRDARFLPVEATPKSTTVEPGPRPILTPMDYGEVVCDDAAAGPATLGVVVATERGARELVLPVADEGEEVLTRLHEAACRERAVADAATISFGDDWESTAAAVAHGTIAIERGGTEEQVVIEQVQGTVILSLTVLDAGEEPVLVLERGQRTAEVAVEVSAARCDPHALIESKRTYSFPLWVRVGDAPTTYVVLEPEGGARDTMESLLATGCDLEW